MTRIPRIVRQSARALLFDRDQRLVLIKRTRPGQEPYWVTVGGGLEPQDPSVEAALRREVLEELGGHIDRLRQVLLITGELPHRLGLQHIFVARLTDHDLTVRTGTEFSGPSRGSYEVVHLSPDTESLDTIQLMPIPLARFLHANLTGLRALVEQVP